MSSDFNPYREWLSIPANELPTNYYRLLGLALFETDANVISNAADRQMAFVRSFQRGQYSEQSQQLLNELAQARVTLLDKQKKAEYDAKLRADQKSGSNGGIGVVSSLGSYGAKSAPPPLASSLTPPQPLSNNFQSANPSYQGQAKYPENNTVHPIDESLKPSASFLEKHWIALLSALFAAQLIICGIGLLAFSFKWSKTEVAQNTATVQTQKEDVGEISSPEAARQAEQRYKQSVELQEKGDYNEALNKINVALELQPDNEQYKVQQEALIRLKTSEDKAKMPTTTVKGEYNPISTAPDSESQAEDGKSSSKTSLTPEEIARREAEDKARREEIIKAKAIYKEAVELQEEGKYIQAAEKLDEAIELDPDNEQYKEEKSHFEELAKAEESYNESVELEQKEQYAEALVKIEDALAIDPNNEDFIKEKLNIQTGYYKQYVQHRIQREYPQALVKIDKAVELVPKEEFYKEEKQKTEELVKAVEEGKELPEKDPDYGEPEEEPEEPVKDELEQPRGFEPGNKAGERKTVDVDGVEIAFRWCPAGTFIMGSPTSEANRKDDEKEHEVELTKGFWIMETQITVGMFKAFVKDTGYQSKGLTPWGLSNGKWNQNAGYSWLNPGFVQNDDNPVICISWRDATAFSKWLGRKIESKTKLPTEAQWEYACRAGSSTAYFWGDVLNGDKANCNGNYPYGTSVKGPYLEKTVPVRSYQRNNWGVYDMHGNVWEWCLDGYAAYPNGKATDPLERGDGSNRVFRGGSWSYFAERCRSAFRANFVPAIRLPNLGGRCVVEPRDAESKEPDNSSSDKKTGDRVVITINGVEFAFRWAPPGTFKMGGRSGKLDEMLHVVTLTKGFWIMETEVTQKQWETLMSVNPSRFKGDNLPVEELLWEDCQDFCKMCTQLGLPVQLPTEAQWEYSCRAGTTGVYAGDLDEMAWYSNNSDNKTHPVRTKKPNAWGLYDMHGNVWEWCQDVKTDFTSESVTDPTGAARGKSHVVRGGSWKDGHGSCRSANRSSVLYKNSIGFRLASMADLKSLKTKDIKFVAEFEDKDNNAGKRMTKVVDGVEFAFRWCPRGTFIMGMADVDKSWRDDSQHQVILTKGFWMLETEVTVGMFKAFVIDTGYDIEKDDSNDEYRPKHRRHSYREGDSEISWLNPGFSQDDKHPVTCVSWDDAVAFCKWLSEKTGQNITLPTEAQWEYACRAGKTGEYASNLKEVAWFSTDRYDREDKGTHPVGTKKPNEWGLYDMFGNVSEWCQDWYYHFKRWRAINPTGPTTGSARVIRGGSWYSNEWGFRSNYSGRSRLKPTEIDDTQGFRCVMVPEP